MNAHFRNIKVDREERPDVDQAYMAAALALSGQGGWPLNVVCLPDGRPIWASTYLPKDRWLAALVKLVEIRDHHADVPGPYAQKLVDALEGAALPASDDGMAAWDMDAWPWEDPPAWDKDHGGLRGAPKFPLPALWTSLHLLPPEAPFAAAQAHSIHTFRAIFHSGSYDALRGDCSATAQTPFGMCPILKKWPTTTGFGFAGLLRFFPSPAMPATKGPLMPQPTGF